MTHIFHCARKETFGFAAENHIKKIFLRRKTMKKLLSSLVVLMFLLTFSGPAASADLASQSNNDIASALLGSMAGDLASSSSVLKSVATSAQLKNALKGQKLEIYSEEGVKLYIAVVVEKLVPKVKLIAAFDKKPLTVEDSTTLVDGTLVFNVGYNILKSQVTLGLDSDGQGLMLTSQSGKTTVVELKNVNIGIGTGTLNQGKITVSGVAVINGVSVDLGSLSKLIEIFSKTI